MVFGKVNLEVVRLMKWRREGENPGRCRSDPELRGKGLGLGWWQKGCGVKDNTEKHFQRQKCGDLLTN